MVDHVKSSRKVQEDGWDVEGFAFVEGLSQGQESLLCRVSGLEVRLVWSYRLFLVGTISDRTLVAQFT